MVAQAGRYRVVVDIFPDHGLGVVIPGGFVFVAIGILSVGFKVQEVGPDEVASLLVDVCDEITFSLNTAEAESYGQMMRTTPFRRTTLQCSQIGLTLLRTFTGNLHVRLWQS